MKSESGRIIDEVIRRYLHPLLKEHSFVRKARTWNRTRAEFIDVVNVQASQWNTGEAGVFTVNLGVFSPEIHQIISGKQSPTFVKEYQCVVRTRLGKEDNQVTGLMLDQWWKFDSKTDLEQLGREIADLLVTHGFPFVERLNSLEALDAFLTQYSNTKQSTPLDYISLAIVKAQLGNTAYAREILTEVYERFEYYRDLVLAISHRLEINLK
jgi:hypothetical protein